MKLRTQNPEAFDNESERLPTFKNEAALKTKWYSHKSDGFKSVSEVVRAWKRSGETNERED